MRSPRTLVRLTTESISTDAGDGRLHVYRGQDGREHLVLVFGDVTQRRDVLVGIYSECLAGELLGEAGCECRGELVRGRRLIAEEGDGVLIYLRFPGLAAGRRAALSSHPVDPNGDTLVAQILGDLEVESVRLVAACLSRRPGLERLGVVVGERVPTLVGLPVSANGSRRGPQPLRSGEDERLLDDIGPQASTNGRPAVTLAYAQSLDGSITVRRGESMALSGPEAMSLTHSLRARHDVILVGIETVLADDPLLTVRLADGPDPQAVVLDSRLRLPLDSRLIREARRRPWIATTQEASLRRERGLSALGVRVLRMPANGQGQVDLKALLDELARLGVKSVMVEGGARVITSFLARELVDRLVLTITPLLIGGLNAVGNLAELNQRDFPAIRNPRYRWVGDDLLLFGEVTRSPG